MTFPGLVSRLEYCFIRMPSRPSYFYDKSNNYLQGRPPSIDGSIFCLVFLLLNALLHSSFSASAVNP